MKFLLGLLVGVLFVLLAGFFYFWSGMAPAATAASPIPFEKTLARMALDARIRRELPTATPPPVTEANLLAGAQLYKEQCAACHGLPGGTKSFAAEGMFPKPPQLFQGKGVTDDPPGETWWKVTNGIRLTGMPAYGKNLSPEAVWQITLLLQNADKLPPNVQAALAGT